MATAEESQFSVRSELRGLRDVSSTLVGLPAGESRGAQEDDPHIVSFRHLSPSDMEFDARTGEAVLAKEAEDPLGGEVFDTPEFESSQEYVNQNGETGRPEEDAQPPESEEEE